MPAQARSDLLLDGRGRWSALVVGLLLVLIGWSCPGPAAAAPQDWPEQAVWPLSGLPQVLEVFDPPAERWGAGHRGVDLAGAPGAPVLAAADGVVTFAGPVGGREVMTVQHGELRTTYEPVRATVGVGTRVTAGQPIGVLRPGHCEPGPGSCLHWGLLEGEEYLDPTLLPTSVQANSTLRLLPEHSRQRATQDAAVRAQRSAAAGPAAPPGEHGFLTPVQGPVTSRFGPRLHPVLGVRKLHDGLDFGAACGTPIRAARDGVVVQRDSNPGYGERLVLDHGDVAGHEVRTSYNHAIDYSVAAGSTVRRGQVIGRVGSTGYSTGCHLHLMMWVDGGLVDPAGWL